MLRTLVILLSLNGCAFLAGSPDGEAGGDAMLALVAGAGAPVNSAVGDAPGSADPNTSGDAVPASGNFTGPAGHASYPADIVTSDSSSGLTWMSCAVGQTGTTCLGAPTTLDHAAALAYCAGLNTANGGAGYAGRVDWRLPAVKELSTLLDYARDSPAIAGLHFPNTFHVLGHWTADVYPSATGFAYGVGFKYGTTAANNRSGGLYTRCVAGTFAHVSNFQDQGNGIVRDVGSGLMWTRCTLDGSGVPANGAGFDCAAAPGFLDWPAAGNACANLTFGGHADWRLPSIAELKTLIDETSFDPAAYTAAFPNIVAGSQYWSATNYNPFSGDAWRVDSRYGQVSPMTKSTGGQVRCVRTE